MRRKRRKGGEGEEENEADAERTVTGQARERESDFVSPECQEWMGKGRDGSTHIRIACIHVGARPDQILHGRQVSITGGISQSLPIVRHI